MFENDRIHVVEYALTPPAKVAPGMTGPSLLMTLSEANLRIDGGDPRALAEHEVYWSDSGIEMVEAVGDAEAWILVARLGEPAPPPAAPIQPDDGMVAVPTVYGCVFENDRVRVAWVTAPAGAKVPMHSHPGRAYRYVIRHSLTRFIAPDGSTRDANPAPRSVLWSENPSSHAAQNLGNIENQVVLIEAR